MQYDTSGVRDGLGEVKDVDEGKREVLVTIPWETLDTYNTDFARDCFDDYLGQRSPVMCWQHDKKEPIGAVKDWKKGQRANEFVAGFSDFDAVPRAKQAFAQIRDRELTDFSFYYDQAKAIPHPNGERGAVRFTHARMPEISPVTVGSIPGAMATGVREAADAAGIAELVRTHVISEAEGRVMLGLAGGVPDLEQTRDAPVVVGTLSLSDEVTAAFKAMLDERLADLEGQRDEPDDVSTLAGAVDAALDQAADLMADVDLSTRSEQEQQAWALVGAAGVAADALLDTMGLPDPDATDDGGRSATQDEPTVEVAEGERATVSDQSSSEEEAVDLVSAETEAALALLNHRFAS